jgi:hypothetical protein
VAEAVAHTTGVQHLQVDLAAAADTMLAVEQELLVRVIRVAMAFLRQWALAVERVQLAALHPLGLVARAVLKQHLALLEHLSTMLAGVEVLVDLLGALEVRMELAGQAPEEITPRHYLAVMALPIKAAVAAEIVGITQRVAVEMVALAL